MVENMVRESTHGQMTAITKVLGIIIRLKVTVNTFGATVDLIKDTGKTIKCMDLVSISGKMGGNIREIMHMIRRREKENITGQTVSALKVDG